MSNFRLLQFNRAFTELRGLWTRKQNFYVVTIILLIACLLAFNWRSGKLGLGEQQALLDSLFWYKPSDVRDFLNYIDQDIVIAQWQLNGRVIYAITQLTLDIIFPIAYSLLILNINQFLYQDIIQFLYQDRPGNLLVNKFAYWVMIADIAENFATSALSLSFTGDITSWSWLAAIFTASKWILAIINLISISVGFVTLNRVQTFLNNYIYFLRIPIIAGIILVGVPLAAISFAAKLLENLFVMQGFWQLLAATVGATLAALMVAFTYERIFDQIPANNNNDSLHNISPLVRYIIALSLWLPNIFTIGYLSSLEISHIKLILGFLLGIGISYLLIWLIEKLADYIENLFQDPSISEFLSYILGNEERTPEDYLGIALGVIGILIYIIVIYLNYPDPENVKKVVAPAILYIYLLVWVITGIFGVLSSKLDRYGIPIEILAIALSGLGYLAFSVDHIFELKEVSKTEIPSEQIITDNSPKHNILEIETALNKRLEVQGKDNRTLVLIATSGGGIQASGWTTQVLGGLQDKLGVSFTQATGLISSVSGGSVGTMYFVDGFNPKLGYPSVLEASQTKSNKIRLLSLSKPSETLNFKDPALNAIWTKSTDDWLDSVAWGFAYPDLIRGYAKVQALYLLKIKAIVPLV